MSRRIVLLRHGQTPWNVDGRYQGQADVELTESGHQQAKAAADALARWYDVSRIVSSDLLRARTTAGYLADATGVEVTCDPRFREIHVGDASGLTRPEIVARFGEIPASWEPVGGESWAAVRTRFVAGLDEVATELEAGRTVVVVAHGGAIRHGLLGFLGWGEEIMPTLAPLENCSWVELVEGGRPGFAGVGAAWRLAAYNRVCA